MKAGRNRHEPLTLRRSSRPLDLDLERELLLLCGKHNPTVLARALPFTAPFDRAKPWCKWTKVHSMQPCLPLVLLGARPRPARRGPHIPTQLAQSCTHDTGKFRKGRLQWSALRQIGQGAHRARLRSRPRLRSLRSTTAQRPSAPRPHHQANQRSRPHALRLARPENATREHAASGIQA